MPLEIDKVLPPFVTDNSCISLVGEGSGRLRVFPFEIDISPLLIESDWTPLHKFRSQPKTPEELIRKYSLSSLTMTKSSSEQV